MQALWAGLEWLQKSSHPLAWDRAGEQGAWRCYQIVGGSTSPPGTSAASSISEQSRAQKAVHGTDNAHTLLAHMSPPSPPLALQQEDTKDWRRVLRAAAYEQDDDKAKEMLARHWDAIQSVAAAKADNRRITVITPEQQAAL